MSHAENRTAKTRTAKTRTATVGTFDVPHDVDKMAASLGAGAYVYRLMPPYKDIPEAFKDESAEPFCSIQSEWFFNGLRGGFPLKPKPGIDRSKALAHLSAIQRSFEPKHEHKAAGVAYLMSLWFEDPGKEGRP